MPAGWRYCSYLRGRRSTIDDGVGGLGEVAGVHQLRQSLVHRPHVAVELDVGLHVAAVRVQHDEVVPGRRGKDLEADLNGDCIGGGVPWSMSLESAPSCQLASENWKEDPLGTKWYWLVSMMVCCDCEEEEISLPAHSEGMISREMASRNSIVGLQSL